MIMDTVTIYHNPACSKSRETLELLAAHGIEPKIILYLQTPPTQPELSVLLQKLNITARQLLRRSETAFINRGLADESLSDEALLQAMVSEPRLIERPIVVVGKQARLGRPPTQVLELLR